MRRQKTKDKMGKLNYLNIGCGNKFHKDWINVDMASSSPDVISHNLLNGIPFDDNKFDVIYHSQVLEHFPREKTPHFIKECFRVLKPGGIMRIVVPDLENIVNEYKKILKENLKNPSELSDANYDWILLEMYDQTVRNYPGGQMAEYLKQPKIINEKYVMDRIGHVGSSIRKNYLYSQKNNIRKVLTKKGILKKVVKIIKKKLIYFFSESARIGDFRLSGEIHMWMYDRYSLSRLLESCGFKNIKIKNFFDSDIPKWDKYDLDVKDGLPFAPKGLFIEAKKNTHNN